MGRTLAAVRRVRKQRRANRTPQPHARPYWKAAIRSAVRKCARAVTPLRSPRQQSTSAAVAQAAPRLVHTKCRPSLLCTDKYSLQVKMCGFANLAALFVLVTAVSYALTLLRTGSLKSTPPNIDPLPVTTPSPNFGFELVYLPILEALGGMASNAMTAVVLERAALRLPKSFHTVITLLHAANCVAVVVGPYLTVRSSKANFASYVGLMMCSLTLCMKLTSYAMVNTILRNTYITESNLRMSRTSKRRARRSNKGKAAKARKAKANKNESTKQEEEDPTNISYPANVTIGNMCMYIAFPTLVYQTAYPRSAHLRVKYLARHVLELIAGCMALGFCVRTFLVPNVMRSIPPMLALDLVHVLELLLTICVPSICCWLVAFYLFFHVWLNIVAEVTYFGDREFYDDWWTSRDVETFWRKWNKPVHNFLKTQVFVPLVYRSGVSKTSAMLFVFFVSAVAHEVVVSVPLRSLDLFSMHSFGGMMAQVPLVLITKRMPPWLGNSVFWASIMLGQPCGVLLYYRDFVLAHGLPGAAVEIPPVKQHSMVCSAFNLSTTTCDWL
jgi:diacylglycerol O-acyltransferase-1